MPRKENPGPISAQAQQDLVSEGIENFELPKSVVMKIAKSGLPDEARLTKETVLALVKGSTVFINYLGASHLHLLAVPPLTNRPPPPSYAVPPTSTHPPHTAQTAACAHDVALSKQHKTISAADVLKALELVDFGDLIAGLEGEVKVFKQGGAGAGSSSRKGGKDKDKDRESVGGAGGGVGEAGGGTSASTAGKGFSISIPGGGASSSGSIRLPASHLSLSLSGSASASVSASAATSAVGTPTGGVPPLTLKVPKTVGGSASVTAGEEGDEDEDDEDEDD